MLRKICVILCMFLINIEAKITQTSSIMPIESELKKANSYTLVIVELDGGIIMYVDEIFNRNNSKLFHKYVLKMKKKGEIAYDPKIAQKVRSKILYKLTEVAWKNQIQLLQNKEVSVCGISKMLRNNQRLKEEVKRNEISFKQDKTIAKIKFEQGKIEYTSGIIFCYWNDEIQEKLFTNALIKDQFKKVILVSSNRGFLELAEKTCQKNGLEFIGFEYTYIKNMPMLDKKAAKTQIARLFAKQELNTMTSNARS